MNKKEIFKKFWFVGLVAIVLFAFVGIYSYEAYQNREIVVKSKQVDGKDVVYTIDGEPVFADDLYNSLYKTQGFSQAILAYQRAVMASGIETTNEMKDLAANNASYLVSYYGNDYIENYMKQYGYVNGVDDLVDYLIDSQKMEILLKDYLSNNKDTYLKDTIGSDGRLIYHILVKCDVEPIYDDEDTTKVIAYQAKPTEEQAAKLQTILDELAKEDANFEDIANQYSEDTGSASNGGYIGIINSENASMYDSFFAEESLRLVEGEISNTIISQFGYHIIKNAATSVDAMLEDYNFINDVTTNNSNLSVFAIVDKANELGFEIVDETLKKEVDSRMESAGN